MAKILVAKEMSKCIGCFTCMTICAGVNHKSHSLQKSAIHIRTSGGISSGKMIARVCQACHDPACADACPTGALTRRRGGGATLNKSMCIGCGRCEHACIVGAIKSDEEQHLPIICKHCGVCARYCPHECLKMEEIPNVI